ncbi:MAG: phytanoyl-CoA dioxygenase family protein [Chloroflexi bacterium]|nr:phytanoyl-CoA dioxygenase family protein [Chloroflexota bacterium]OJW04333.1 MAG: hypothetical protein BGO39_11250 [Chloroflexi bacterium 54-19]
MTQIIKPLNVTGQANLSVINDSQWADYQRDGYLRLGQLLSPEQVKMLCDRADDLALGKIHNPGIQFQLDTGGAYEELPEAVSSFPEGTLRYRKVQGLENDELYAPLVHHSIFAEISAWHYGPHAPISIFRAMIMNKPAGQGTYLPWHQDGGDVWKLDRDPLVTIWVALDPAKVENGCVEVIPGSHKLGLLSTYGSTINDEDAVRYCLPEQRLSLEVESGHALLMHNWLIHRSGVNPSGAPRRAFTACYMDGRSLNTLTGNHFPLVFGKEKLASNLLYLDYLRSEHQSLQESVRSTQEYVHSLGQENQKLREMFKEAENYALSLEANMKVLKAQHAEAPAPANLPAPAPARKGLRGWLAGRKTK